MRFIKQLLAVTGLSLGLAFVAGSGGSAIAAPTAGKDYKELSVQRSTPPGPKIQVIEFFWYGCPHCSAFAPSVEDWAKKNADKIDFVHVPIQFDPRFEPEQRLYYVLEAMNRLDLHQTVFQTEHQKNQPLNTKDRILAFAAQQGLDKDKFAALYDSFGVQSKVRRATQMQADYAIDGVPTIAVDGRFVTSPAMVGTAMGGNQPEPVLFANTLKLMDFLVMRAATDNAAKANAAKMSKPAAK